MDNKAVLPMECLGKLTSVEEVGAGLSMGAPGSKFLDEWNSFKQKLLPASELWTYTMTMDHLHMEGGYAIVNPNPRVPRIKRVEELFVTWVS